MIIINIISIVCLSVCVCVCVSAERPVLYFEQQPPSDVIGHVGGSVYINCSARSRDAGQVEVTWLREGRDAVVGVARRSVSETGALVVAPVMMTSQSVDGDDGVYVCVVKHGNVSIVSTPVTLHIASESLCVTICFSYHTWQFIIFTIFTITACIFSYSLSISF